MSRRRVSRPAWDTYIRRFHAERPGITETVLTRCHRNGQTPYEWVTDTMNRDSTVIDLACGSAPTRRHFDSAWVGVDASTEELAAAGSNTAGRVVAGELSRLPFRDAGFDQALCSMALMVIDPLLPALAEIRRVLRPGAEVRILLPASSPLTAADRRRYARLSLALGTGRLFPPTPLNTTAETIFDQANLTLLHDERGRFAYRIETTDHADLLINSLYLPQPTERRITAAHRVATRWIGNELGIPLRRITASVPPSS